MFPVASNRTFFLFRRSNDHRMLSRGPSSSTQPNISHSVAIGSFFSLVCVAISLTLSRLANHCLSCPSTSFFRDSQKDCKSQLTIIARTHAQSSTSVQLFLHALFFTDCFAHLFLQLFRKYSNKNRSLPLQTDLTLL